MHILAVYCHLCLWGIEEKKNHVHMQTAHELIGERERVKKERGAVSYTHLRAHET